MKLSDPKPKLLVLVGPSASGKTATAILLAEQLNGEIISADSRYFYRELQIGTAKPTGSELSQAKHHFVDITTLSKPWSLGEFKAEADRLIVEINSRGKLPILVGGSGQYIRAITDNWSIPAQPPDNRLRLALESWGETVGFDQLHIWLSWLDSEAAILIDPRNHRRTVRALEVIFLSGRKFSEQRRALEPRYNQLMIGLDWPRELLYNRVDQRIEEMIVLGLVAETEKVVDSGFGDQLRKVGIIGYTEILDHLEGKLTLEEAIVLIKRNTRRFIRHQTNWFKLDNPDIHWLNAQDPTNVNKIVGLVDDKFTSKSTE